MSKNEIVWYINFHEAPKEPGVVTYASYSIYEENPQTKKRTYKGAKGMNGYSHTHKQGVHLNLADELIEESQRNPNLQFRIGAETPRWLIDEFKKYLTGDSLKKQ